MRGSGSDRFESAALAIGYKDQTIQSLFYVLLKATDMKKNLIIFLSIIGASCSSTYFIVKPKSFTYLHQATPTGLDSILAINGYYISDEHTVITEETLKSIKTEKTVGLLVFYSNGLMLRTGGNSKKDVYESIIDKDKSKDFKQKHLRYQWGTYRLSKDTIKTQLIINYGPMISPGVVNSHYLILSDTVISKIYEKELTSNYVRSNSNNGENFYFRPYSNRIDSIPNPYLKKKWFWEKDAYKMK